MLALWYIQTDWQLVNVADRKTITYYFLFFLFLLLLLLLFFPFWAKISSGNASSMAGKVTFHLFIQFFQMYYFTTFKNSNYCNDFYPMKICFNALFSTLLLRASNFRKTDGSLTNNNT